MKVAVVASGDLDPGDAAVLDAVELVIAADGGATSLETLARRPHLVVGDLDSADPATIARLEATGTVIERHPADKEASDTELALEAARAAGATSIVLIGAAGGGRIDHELANVLLLADPALAGCDLRLVHRGRTVRLLTAGQRAELEAGVGELVSLLPLADATGVTTEGLRWPLEGATLPVGRSRGLSNEVVARPASVSLQGGRLLVVESSSTGGLA